VTGRHVAEEKFRGFKKTVTETCACPKAYKHPLLIAVLQQPCRVTNALTGIGKSRKSTTVFAPEPRQDMPV
jgi:hypothetical protein